MMNLFIKKITFLGIFLLLVTGNVFAQSEDLYVEILNLDTHVKSVESNDKVIWYYDINGKVVRNKDEDIFLMLRDASGLGIPYKLADYQKGGPDFDLKFPSEDPYTGIISGTISDVLVPGHSYELYFSSDVEGFNPVSYVYLVDEIPSGDQQDDSNSDDQEDQDQTGSGGTSDPNDPDKSAGSGGSGVVYNETQLDIIDNGLVPTDCGYNLKTLSNPEGTGRLCVFTDAIRLVQRIIEYIFVLVLPIAAIIFAYAGFLLLTSGGDTKKRDDAKRAMTNLVIGIFIIMVAWLAVKTILVSLGVDKSFLIYLDL